MASVSPRVTVLINNYNYQHTEWRQVWALPSETKIYTNNPSAGTRPAIKIYPSTTPDRFTSGNPSSAPLTEGSADGPLRN